MTNNEDEILRCVEYVRKLSKKDPAFATKKFYVIEEVDKNSCLNLIKDIEDINDDIKSAKGAKLKNELSRKKGKMLEHLAKKVIETCDLFQVLPNIRDNSNEIDLLLKPSDYNKVTKVILPEFLCNDVVVECKNYNKKISVDWTGKFYSLIKSHSLKFGILFSFERFAGNSEWASSRGLVKKMFLKEEVIIINICIDDIKFMFNNNLNFVELINIKYGELQHHTSYTNLITKHPAEV